MPTPFLKKAFLVYNKIKILTIDKLIFPEYKIPLSGFHLYRNGYPFRELGISLDELPEGELKKHMCAWNDWTQEEFILSLDKPCWIEPQYGWAVVSPNKLIYYSLGVSRTWFQPKPDLLKWIRKKRTILLERTISLRDSGEENYFHFFNEILSKLFFLQQHSIDISAYSIIISNRLWNKPYFKFIYEHSTFLSSLTWFVQNDEYILANHSIFCKPITHRKDLWSSVLSLFPALSKSFTPQRIFLTRSKARLRFIENIEEVERICHKFNFITIDTDKMAPEQQIVLFENTRYLVGIHGAGLTNMVFRKHNCSVFEIFPPPELGYLPFHYMMLAKMSGFNYGGCIGEAGRSKYSGGFYVDPAAFESDLESFLKST